MKTKLCILKIIDVCHQVYSNILKLIGKPTTIGLPIAKISYNSMASINRLIIRDIVPHKVFPFVNVKYPISKPITTEPI